MSSHSRPPKLDRRRLGRYIPVTMQTRSQALRPLGEQFAQDNQFLCHSTNLSQKNELEALSRPALFPEEVEAVKSLLSLISSGDHNDKYSCNIGVQYRYSPTFISSTPASSAEERHQAVGRRDSCTNDSGYGSSENPRSISPSAATNSKLGTGAQSRKVVRQAQRRKEQRAKTFVGLRPSTDERRYTERGDQYIIRRRRLYADLHDSKTMPRKEFQADYNSRFPNEKRTVASLTKRAKMIEGR